MNLIKFLQQFGLRPSLFGFFVLLLSVAGQTTHAEDNSDAPTVVVLGDSLSAGYQLPPGAGFPERLQVALDDRGFLVKIQGAGVSGDTSSGGLARLAWSVPTGTDGVLLELGANDALRGLPPELTRKNIEAMISQLQTSGSKVFLIGIKAPPNMGEDYAKAFDAIYPELAAKYDIPLYPFFLDGVATVPELNLADAMHPNEKGVEVMVERILPKVEQFIDSLRPSP